MNQKFTLAMMFILFAGCTNVAEIDIALERPIISVNSVFNADSTWQVSVTRSRNVLDDVMGSYFEPVDNARVTLKDGNGNLVETLSYTLNNFSYMYRSNARPEIGRNYVLQVAIDNDPVLQAKNCIPLSVPIESVQIDSAGFHSDGTDIKMKISFSDPEQVKNYYALKILRNAYHIANEDTIRFIEDVNFEPIDPAFQDYFSTGASTVFNDNLFQGKSYSFQVQVSPYFNFGTTERITVMLLSVSEEYYEYFTTKNLQYSKREDPFAQPVQVFTNIQNGVGIFAGYSSSVFIVN